MSRQDEIACLIGACQPGKHFMGLWVVRHKRFPRRKPHDVKFTVTYWDRRGEYVETRWYKDPIRALRACAEDLGKAEREP